MVKFAPLDIKTTHGYAVIPVEGDMSKFGIQGILSLRVRGDMGPHTDTRRRFLLSLKLDEDRIFHLRQIHSKRVFVAKSSQRKKIRASRGDGLIASSDADILSVTVADCLPIFILDKEKGNYGILHSGWEGTGIVMKALELMQHEFDTELSSVRVILGPGIGKCCYQVSKERYDLFRHRFGNGSVRKQDGAYFLDLRGANLAVLSESCVNDITVIEDCTCCNAHLSSFRREGQNSFTRMLALVGHLIEE